MLNPFTGDLAAVMAAQAVPLALWDRHSVTLRRTADVAAGVDRAVLAEGKGWSAARSGWGRAALEPIDVRTDVRSGAGSGASSTTLRETRPG